MMENFNFTIYNPFCWSQQAAEMSFKLFTLEITEAGSALHLHYLSLIYIRLS